MMRLFSEPGCGRKIPNEVRFCDECKTGKRTDDGIRSHTNADRATHATVYRSKRWQQVQKLIIARDPVCKRCAKVLSEIADHVVPAGVAIEQALASRKWPLDPLAGFFLMSNLQGLCRSCHGLKTNEDKAHGGTWTDVVEVEGKAPKKWRTF